MNENLYKALGLLGQAPGAANAETIGREARALDEFVSHEQPQRLLSAAGWHAGMGQINMRKRLFARIPKFTQPP